MQTLKCKGRHFENEYMHEWMAKLIHFNIQQIIMETGIEGQETALTNR